MKKKEEADQITQINLAMSHQGVVIHQLRQDLNLMRKGLAEVARSRGMDADARRRRILEAEKAGAKFKTNLAKGWFAFLGLTLLGLLIAGAFHSSEARCLLGTITIASISMAAIFNL